MTQINGDAMLHGEGRNHHDRLTSRAGGRRGLLGVSAPIGSLTKVKVSAAQAAKTLTLDAAGGGVAKAASAASRNFSRRCLRQS